VFVISEQTNGADLWPTSTSTSTSTELFFFFQPSRSFLRPPFVRFFVDSAKLIQGKNVFFFTISFHFIFIENEGATRTAVRVRNVSIKRRQDSREESLASRRVLVLEIGLQWDAKGFFPYEASLVDLESPEAIGKG